MGSRRAALTERLSRVRRIAYSATKADVVDELNCGDPSRCRRLSSQSASSFLGGRPAAPSVTAVQEVGHDEYKRDRELDQYDYAEAGRERDREQRDEERGGGVLKQVAASAREVLRASPAVESGSR